MYMYDCTVQDKLIALHYTSLQCLIGVLKLTYRVHPFNIIIEQAIFLLMEKFVLCFSLKQEQTRTVKT